MIALFHYHTGECYIMNFLNFFSIAEWIGTVSFAISGVMAAREYHMDVFGAVVLGCATAVGGGMIRDLILGVNPPMMFRNPSYVLISFIASLISFFLLYHHVERHDFMILHQEQTERILNLTDSLGLAVFVVVGCRTAMDAGYSEHCFLCCFVGVVTGIGGGILRDMMAGQMSIIMRKRVYGVAAILGAISYVYLIAFGVSELAASVVSMLLTCLIRFLAIHFRWNLPCI